MALSNPSSVEKPLQFISKDFHKQQVVFDQSAVAVEYTNCISAEW